LVLVIATIVASVAGFRLEGFLGPQSWSMQPLLLFKIRAHHSFCRSTGVRGHRAWALLTPGSDRGRVLPLVSSRARGIAMWRLRPDVAGPGWLRPGLLVLGARATI